jgi:hypothetical protein
MMMAPRFLLLCFGLVSVSLAACENESDALLDGPENSPHAGKNDVLAEALQCTEKPAGRSYTFFDGTKLEDRRLNENGIANRARFKPHAVMAGEYRRVLGVVPKSLERAAASFDAPPERWFAEPAHSGVSLSAAFSISFEACAGSIASSAEQAQAPTEESAKHYCATLMRKAWSRSPSPEEIGGCVDLATQKLGDEPDARRRWSYVCASILSSSYFLTF